MIGIEVRFLAGRFHGTAWNSAHNEGVPEWPPSPWRVLRALASAAHAEEVPSAAAALFERLRGLPSYRLPRAAEAHLRHYMPDAHDPNHKRTKVFDAFVAVQGGPERPAPLTIAWSADLTTDERALLDRLCRRVPYLGRAEAWCELRLVDVDGSRWDCWPDDEAPAEHATTLLALEPREAFEAWVASRPKPKRGRDIPRSLWDVLTFDGDRFRREGWSRVPGTRLARYVFDDAPFARAIVPRSAHAAVSSTRLPTVARYAIRSAVLPRVQQALFIGERLRQAVMSHSERVSGNARPVFSGHGLSGSHPHAMYLPTSDVTHGFIDHLVVHAKMGFEPEDVQALQSVRRLWGKGGHDLELVLVSLGDPADHGGPSAPRAPVLAASRAWRSFTPFVPTRHPKVVRGEPKDSIEQQLRLACQQLLGVAPTSVTPYGDRAWWSRFRRRRSNGGGHRGPDWAIGARLVFDQPVRGPIALGYGAHFGLGLFVPDDDQPPRRS